MYDFNVIKNSLFIDIETVPEYEQFDILVVKNKAKSLLWTKVCNKIRASNKDKANLNDNELYKDQAGLHAEFLKIICISIGSVIDFNKIQLLSFINGSETNIIENTYQLIDKYSKATAKTNIVGYNLKKFDMTVLAKRAIINNVLIPDRIQTHKLKPWETPFTDLAEDWNFGTFNSMISLDLLTNVLGIPTPKDDIIASDIQKIYYVNNDIERIKVYCEKDVLATINVMLRFSNFSIIEPDMIEHVSLDK